MDRTRRLHLLRHAKSSWEDPMQSDHDRTLAPRGRRAARLLHAHVRDHAVTPELVLCSTSRRTQETVREVDPGGELRLEPRLYGASAEELLARLHRLDDRVGEVMVVGHNPALQMLVLSLVPDQPPTEPVSTARADIRAKFPTGALATVSFQGSWASLSPAGARLESYVRPKALAAS